MGVPYGWFLSRSFSRDQVLDFVRTVPNAGLTEPFDGAWVDVYRATDGSIQVDRADVDAFADELERGGGGTFSYTVASALELAKCIAVEMPEGDDATMGPHPKARFEGYAWVDLGKALAGARGLLDDGFDEAHTAELEALCRSLSRALELHVAVVIEE